MPQLKNPFAEQAPAGGSAYASNPPEPSAASGSKKGSIIGGAWGRTVTPTEADEVPAVVQNSSTIQMDLSAREAALKKREAELAAREAQLGKREEELTKAGALIPKKNWPLPCLPILYHDIAKEIPEHLRSMVRACYICWMALCVCLLYQLVCCCIMLGYKDAPDRVGSWFLAIIYTAAGIPLSWIMWYRRLYNASKNNGSITYFWFFLFFAVHIAFSIWAAIAVPISTERWSFTGFMSAMSAFDVNNFIGVLYIIGACLWGLEALWSIWTMKMIYFNFRNSGGAAKAKQQAQQTAVASFLGANRV